MVLFIFFNSFHNSTEQWKKNPYDSSIKSSLINKIKKFGQIYLYNPIFYNFNIFNQSITNHKYSSEFEFTIESMNLEKHCEKLFEEVYKIDNRFILISHDTGFLLAHVFANLYEENVLGFININGGYTKEWLKSWLDQDKLEYIKKIKNRELKVLFENLKSNKRLNDTLNLLNLIVKFNLFKQYHKSYSDVYSFDCPIISFNNIKLTNNLETIEKFKFNNKLELMLCNAKTLNYMDKNDFLYFYIEKDIIEIINQLINNINLADLDWH